MKRTARIALIAAFSTVATSAFAASARPRPLPECARVKHTTGFATQTVYVTNRCPDGVGWYIDKEGRNIGCIYTRKGHTTSWKWPKLDAYHGTFRC